jgi:hypothetical protein
VWYFVLDKFKGGGHVARWEDIIKIVRVGAGV